MRIMHELLYFIKSALQMFNEGRECSQNLKDTNNSDITRKTPQGTFNNGPQRVIVTPLGSIKVILNKTKHTM